MDLLAAPAEGWAITEGIVLRRTRVGAPHRARDSKVTLVISLKAVTFHGRYTVPSKRTKRRKTY